MAAAATPLRVVLVGLDRMSRELVREILSGDPGIVSDIRDCAELDAQEVRDADVTIAAAGVATDAGLRGLLEHRGRACVVAMDADGVGTLYELVPRVRVLGALTPQLLREVLAARAG
jgi:hypothetical protein